jgi:FkbM family methyltransferase
MIPSMGMLEAAAGGVLNAIPRGLTQGTVSTGLYGIGFLGRWALPRLKQRGVKLVSCHDANESLNGTFIDGLPVHAAGQLKSARPDFLIVTARHAVKPVSGMLSDFGIPHVSYDAWHVAADFAAFRGIHDHILADDRSKAVLRAVLMTMLTGETAYCEAVADPDQYFCLPDFSGARDEVYIDAGAYDGDSMESFIRAHDGHFSKIFAFEPGPVQFAALKARAARLVEEWPLDAGRISLVNAGLGGGGYTARADTANGTLTSFATGTSGDNGVAIEIVSLDTYLKGARITFLKADVEGMELAMLKGAQATIRRDKPKIAVCVYHYPTDIPEIANYLCSLVPDYRIALRHHSPQMMETVLYCWAE